MIKWRIQVKIVERVKELIRRFRVMSTSQLLKQLKLIRLKKLTAE